jgi:probable O-glycosylation ligase (exosortase A-associated)
VRDILLTALLLPMIVAALRKPWVGIIGWVWVSLMSPHRYTYGFAHDLPWAQLLALATFGGMMFSKQWQTAIIGSPARWTIAFCIWMTLSWLFGYDADGDYEQWKKVMKIFLVIFLALSIMRTRQHIVAMAWVCALSIGLLGFKGGLHTIATGGGGQVLGPPGSFINDNNTFGLALLMTVPLLRFLHLQTTNKWGRWALLAIMVLTALAALGTQSRGTLVGMIAMTTMLWLRGGKHLTSGVVIALAAVLLVTFMPDSWTEKMSSIKDYENDTSSRGRINSWYMAIGIASNNFFGAGFNAQRIEYYLQYAPYHDAPLVVAHSIYFQVLGHHGWVGLLIFLGILFSTWRVASRVRAQSKGRPELEWCWQLAGMCQVSLVGFMVGGAFLSLAYFDLPYYVMVMVVLMNLWIERRGWETDPAPDYARWHIPGMATKPAVAPQPQPQAARVSS